MTETQWLTIAEAANALQISERQARRYAGRLSADDRREPDSGPDATPDMKVLRVRLSAMAFEREKATGTPLNVTMPDIEPDTKTQRPDTTPDSQEAQAGHGNGHIEATPDMRPDAQNGAIAQEVHQLRTEIEQLKAFIAGGAMQAITERLAQLPDVETIRSGMREEVAQAVKDGISEALQADVEREAEQQAQTASKDDVAALAKHLERISQQMETVADENAVLRRELQEQKEKRGFFGRLFGGG